jgi:hypothetical protein
MKVKVSIVEVLTALFLFATCTSNNPDFKNLIGKEYRTMAEFEIMNGFAEQVGIMLESFDGKEYGLAYYKKGDLHVITFDRVIRHPDGTTSYSVLDILAINGLGNTQYVKCALCRLHGKNDTEIVSIYRYQEGVQFLTKISKAWRANRKTEKFERIDTKGIDCINERHSK